LLEKGADVSDNWKSTTNLLVAKDPNGNSSKIKKAKEKGITILSLEEAYVHFIYKR
jgi:NAD-dependent DNA ligase